MISERIKTAIIAALLSAVAAYGAVGSLITAFSFDTSLFEVMLIVVFAATIGAVCGAVKHRVWAFVGGAAALVLFALAADAVASFCYLIDKISAVYHAIYGCGVTHLADGLSFWSIDTSLIWLGCAVAFIAAWCLAARRNAVLPVLLCALPMIPCFVTTDTVPRNAEIAMVLGSILMMLLTADAKKRDEEKGNALTLPAVISVACVLSLLLFFIPSDIVYNEEHEWRDRVLEALGIEIAGANGNGFGETDSEEDLLYTMSFAAHYDPLMTVTSSVGGIMYFREQVYDEYTGTKWLIEDGKTSLPFHIADRYETVRIDTQDAFSHLYFPCYVNTTQTLTDGHINNTEKKTSYGWAMKLPDEDWKEAAQKDAADLYSWVGVSQLEILRDGYSLNMTKSKLPTDVYMWAQDHLDAATAAVSEEASVNDIAEAVAAYVRGSAQYSQLVQTPPEDLENFAQWFLEEQDRGYCVHFATTTAVLLRALGVEARYVTGYAAEVAADTPTVVREKDSHAWVEYYEPEIGDWVVVEATPSVFSGTQHTTATAPTVTTTTTVITPTTTVTRPTAPKNDDVENGGNVWWIVGVAVLVLGAAAVTIIVPYVSRKRYERSNQNDKLLIVWHRIERIADRKKRDIPRDIEQLAKKAKFSQHTITDEELQAVIDTLQKLKM